nr:hypothetical protein [uncultured Albidiferax sp.]
MLVLLVCALLTVLLSLRTANLSPSHDPSADLHSRQNLHATDSGAAETTEAHQHLDSSHLGDQETHQQGHSESDHTHESIFVAHEYALTTCTARTDWRLREAMMGQDALVTGLERPPKPTTA